MNQSFDILIAGGGLAGCLAAARIAESRPGLSLALVEAEPQLGGRLRTHHDQVDQKGRWGYGLNRVTPALFEFINQTLKANPEAGDLPDLMAHRQERLAVLAGNAIDEFAACEFFAAKGAKAIGGAAGAREWVELQPLIEQFTSPELAESHLGAAWTAPRKGAAATVLEAWSGVLGIPEMWHASCATFASRALAVKAGLHDGAWDEALQALLNNASKRCKLEVFTRHSLITAAREGEGWRVLAEQTPLTAKALVVAMPPWPAITWLPKPVWPQAPLFVTMRTKPVSAVVLAERLLLDRDLPDVLFVPAEGVQILVRRDPQGGGEVTFQAALDYEMSLQAPAVVKAVRSLKRARKRLLQVHPGVVTEEDHLALVPVAWSQSPLQSDRKALEKLDRPEVQSPSLAFCGDAP